MLTEDKKDLMSAGVKSDSVYKLSLFVAGTSPLSMRAINNLKIILQNLELEYELDVIDIHQQPLLALSEDINAVPMLIKKFPAPKRKLIGDMSDTAKVLRGLGVK